MPVTRPMRSQTWRSLDGELLFLFTDYTPTSQSSLPDSCALSYEQREVAGMRAQADVWSLKSKSVAGQMRRSGRDCDATTKVVTGQNK